MVEGRKDLNTKSTKKAVRKSLEDFDGWKTKGRFILNSMVKLFELFLTYR